MEVVVVNSEVVIVNLGCVAGVCRGYVTEVRRRYVAGDVAGYVAFCRLLVLTACLRRKIGYKVSTQDTVSVPIVQSQ